MPLKRNRSPGGLRHEPVSDPLGWPGSCGRGVPSKTVFVLINTVMRRQRRRLLAVAAVLALAGTVTVAHSAMGGDHMGDGMAMCVAVLAVAGVAVIVAVAGAPRSWLPIRWNAPRADTPRIPLLALVPQPRARAGPSSLQVFRL